MDIKLVSSVIFVKDMQASRRFYEETLGQKVLMDHGPNVGFEGGFALWQADHAAQMIYGALLDETQPACAPQAELYFETTLLDEAFQRVTAAGVEVIHPPREQPWGQRVFRFFDLDRHIIELGEPMGVVIFRYLGQGLSVEAIAQKTFMPLEIVQQIAAMA